MPAAWHLHKAGGCATSARPIRRRMRFFGEARSSPRAMQWLGLEVQHRTASLQINRHRVLMMHDQPLAVDLAEACGPPQQEISLLPSVQGSAYAVEAVGEGHILAHRDGQALNIIADRTLER